MAHADLIDLDIDLDLDIGMEDETNATANQIATELDLGLVPRLPTVATNATGVVASLPANAAAALDRSTALAADISNQLQANMNMGNKQADALADAIITNVEADQTIALSVDTADLIAQNRTIEIFQALGGHAAQVDRAKDARAFEIQLEALSEKRADILDDEHVGNSIIDGVINSFRVYRTEVALEATARQAALNQQDIVSATATTQSAAQTNALVRQIANEGTIAANQRKIVAAGDADLYRAVLEQNASNAETLKTMLSVSNQEMSNIMRGYELAGSIENRGIARERHQLELQRFARESLIGDVAIKRARLALRRDIIETEIGEATATERQQALLDSFTQQGVALDQSILNLSEAEETSDDRRALVLVARKSAERALDAANLAFDRNSDPAQDIALKAQRDLAILNFERAEFEFGELQETTDLRQATREGALEAQTLNNLTLERNERIAALLEEGRKVEAVAELEDLLKDRADAAVVEANNVATVQAYQSFIFGAHAVEDAAVINAQLDSGNPFYQLMRQLSSARGPNGEFILGTTPAKANEHLLAMEQRGVVSSEITGIRILREVRNIILKEDIDFPKAIPTDEVSKAIRFNKEAFKFMETQGTEIVFGDATNPLQPPTIPQMVEMSPTLAAQPLFSKVLIPEKDEDTNPDTIIAKGIVAINAKTLSQEQVVEGIVAMGNVIGLNNNINHHGMATVGLPYMSQVNMRVMRPRGFVASVLDDIQSATDPFIIPVGIGIITTGAILAAPVSGGSSLALGSAGVSALTASALGTLATGVASVALRESSDFTTLNIADPVAVRQHLIAILSSSSLGGEDTEDVLDVARGEE